MAMYSLGWQQEEHRQGRQHLLVLPPQQQQQHEMQTINTVSTTKSDPPYTAQADHAGQPMPTGHANSGEFSQSEKKSIFRREKIGKIKTHKHQGSPHQRRNRQRRGKGEAAKLVGAEYWADWCQGPCKHRQNILRDCCIALGAGANGKDEPVVRDAAPSLARPSAKRCG